MALDVVERAAEFVACSGMLDKQLTVLWHAGEPLALKPDYYSNAINRIKHILSSKVDLKFSFQTNAIALNHEWCEFIKSNKIGIGVSIDGPQEIHDSYRITKKGKGTFVHTMKGIELLDKHNIPFSTISVISDKSLGRANEIASFLLSLNPINIGFNIEETEGYNNFSSLTNKKESIEEFINSLYLHLDEANALAKCREFKYILQKFANVNRREQAPRRGENKPFSIITVTNKGMVSTFSPELCGYPVEDLGNFTFGNVFDDFDSFKNNQELRRAYNLIEKGVELCKSSCEYFRYCGGGAPSNKYQENKSFASTETMHCSFHNKIIVDTVKRNILSDKLSTLPTMTSSDLSLT